MEVGEVVVGQVDLPHDLQVPERVGVDEGQRGPFQGQLLQVEQSGRLEDVVGEDFERVSVQDERLDVLTEGRGNARVARVGAIGGSATSGPQTLAASSPATRIARELGRRQRPPQRQQHKHDAFRLHASIHRRILSLFSQQTTQTQRERGAKKKCRSSCFLLQLFEIFNELIPKQTSTDDDNNISTTLFLKIDKGTKTSSLAS